MVFSNHPQPLEDYITKLLLLETVRCATDGNAEGLEYLQNVMYDLALRWGATKRPRN